MAYSELVKNFDRIRDYMRQFYVYGFKSRTEYDQKSARSYDNERRRIESWLGDYMRFRQTPEGKNVFLSVDSRSIPGNPLYNAFKAKSFTAGDVTFHFYVLDLLQDGAARTAQEIVDAFWEKYLFHFESEWEPDISTIRKKLKEYTLLGILQAEKRGRELYYSRSPEQVELAAWADAATFFAEADPLGVIGSTLLDQLNRTPEYYRFKHHYILHTLDSQIMLQLLEAIGARRTVKLTNVSQRSGENRQVVHLVAHPTGGNWLMMESNGVYTFSALFPELRDAAANRAVATERLLREMRKQILPDGMHNELSPDSQTVVYNCAINFYRLAGALGLADEVPQDFVELIHKTAHAAVLLSTPALTQPRTNDTYTMHTRLFTERTALLPGEHPEYRYVNSRRAEGQPPAGETASAYLPYAGFAVMRSDWGADATYLCFDVGPLGAGHMHQDKLNINLYRGSEELIFDDGGGQYESSPARAYALSAYDHNTVLVDGMAQHRTSPLVVQEPIDAHWVSNATFDYAAATYDDGYKRAGMSAPVRVAAHRREVRFCKPAFFCVRDTLTSLDGNAHEYELLFHLDTTRVNVLQDDTGAVLSDFGRTYELLIVPLDDEGEVSVSAVSGQTEPSLRGWYNGRNESKLHEAITVSRTVRGVRNFCFTSLLFPVRRGEPLPKVVRQGDEVVVALGRREYRLNLRALRE